MKRPLLWASLLYAFYAAAGIWRISFPSPQGRVFLLFDDAMISMRFARNFSLGHGLLWNPGLQPVEGFTNPLWTLLMAGFHRLGLAAIKVSLLVQVTGALCVLGAAWSAALLTRAFSQQSQPAVALAAFVLVAFDHSLNIWSWVGMEVGLLALFTGAALWLALQKAAWKAALALAIAAVGVWVRVDFVVCGVVLAMGLGAQRRSWGWALASLGTVLASLALQTVLRHDYYGAWLPNTYYLKMTGYPAFWRLAHGLDRALAYVLGNHLWVLLLPVAALAWAPGVAVWTAAAVFTAQLAYSAYVGGDAWEYFGGANRYIAQALPVWYALYAIAAWELSQRAADFARRRGRLWLRPGLAMVLLVGAGLYLHVAKETTGRRAWKRWLLIERPLHADDDERVYGRAMVCQALALPGAKVANTGGLGTVAYFCRDCVSIDELGKCDPVIAQLPMHLDWAPRRIDSFYPGHLKWDYDYSIRQLQPDYIDSLHKGPEAILPYLRENYVSLDVGGGATVWMRKGSNKIDWDAYRARSQAGP